LIFPTISAVGIVRRVAHGKQQQRRRAEQRLMQTVILYGRWYESTVGDFLPPQPPETHSIPCLGNIVGPLEVRTEGKIQVRRPAKSPILRHDVK
jgi:hypothetical protein